MMKVNVIQYIHAYNIPVLNVMLYEW